MPSLLTRLNGARHALFGYDAAASGGKRKAIAPLMRSEDRELTTVQRSKLVAATRDLPRNFAVAAWAVRKHLDYVSAFDFQATTGDDALDDRIEQLIRWRSRKENCDVARRHPLPRLVRMWEERRTIDGDVLISRTAGGRLQTIEADRVRNPGGGADGVDMSRVVDGVELDAATGEALRYFVSNRKPKSDGMEYAGAVDARHADLLAYYTRIDQLRGVAPLAPAINTFRDVYENFDYALAKAKVAQLFAMAVYREADDTGNSGLTPTAEPEAEGGDDEPRYAVDFKGGPIFMDLDPGDRAEILESDQPGAAFQDFTATMIGVGLKALDIPLCFYDEGRANFSSGRQAWILYEQSSTSKRADLREVLDNNTGFWLAGWVLDGTLALPAGRDFSSISWRWNHAGIPWMDPLKEITADIAAVRSGMDSRTRLLRARGLNYYDVVDELAQEKAYADARGVTLDADAMDLAAAARNAEGEQTKGATDP